MLTSPAKRSRHAPDGGFPPSALRSDTHDGPGRSHRTTHQRTIATLSSLEPHFGYDGRHSYYREAGNELLAVIERSNSSHYESVERLKNSCAVGPVQICDDSAAAISEVYGLEKLGCRHGYVLDPTS